jgi:hypothetical protein
MFPRNSAFHEDQRARESREADALFPPPLRTPEENRRIADANREEPKISIPVKVFEEWVADLEYLAGGMRDDSDALTVEDIADTMRSHLPG